MTAFSCGPTVKKTGAEKRGDHQHHHDFDNRKTAAQRLGQRARTGVHCRHRLVLVVVVMMMFVIAHFVGELVGKCWNKSNGGVRSSKIKVAR